MVSLDGAAATHQGDDSWLMHPAQAQDTATDRIHHL